MDTSYRFDDYEILEELGIGTTATVYRAYDIKLKRTVALKIIHRELSKNQEFLERFYREARIIAQIDHPSIVKIYSLHTGDTPFIVEEFVEGKSLREVIEKRAPFFPDEMALFILKKILEGLKIVHEKGIVHRDLKAENIILSGKGYPKIIDFGLAHLPGVERLTQDGSLMGSIPYSSPEQLTGKKVLPSSDIFSLGVILYEMLTSHHPFCDSNELGTIINSILTSRPRPVMTFRTDLTPEVEKLIMKMLAKNPEERFRNASELLNEVEKLLSVSGIDWEKWYEDWWNGRSATADLQEKMVDFLKFKLYSSANPIDIEEIKAKLEKFGHKMGKLTLFYVRNRRFIQTIFFLTIFFLFIFLSPQILNIPSFTPFHRPVYQRKGVEKIKEARKEKTKIVKKNKKKPPSLKFTVRQNNREKIEVGKGKLKIVTFPWAEVYVDGKYVGKTPFLEEISLEKGIHILSLRNPYTFPVTMEVTISGDQEIEKRVRLEFLPTYIKIIGKKGVTYFLNGRRLTESELNRWIKSGRKIEIKAEKEGKQKKCNFKLLPGMRKEIFCVP